MRHRVRVNDIIEENNCAGKKSIYITTKDTKSVNSKFIMTKDYRSPYEKLILASVAHDDEVEVYVDPISSKEDIVGEYFAISSITGPRYHSCPCGSTMVSDGIDVYCLDNECGMTIASRLKRLGSTPFFNQSDLGDWLPFITDDYTLPFYIGDDPDFSTPFRIINNPKIWGINYANIEEALLDYKGVINLSTFLIESEFSNFLDNHYNCGNPYILEFRNVERFYNTIQDFAKNRSFNCLKQYKFIKEFLWCLGIESLSLTHIDALINYELCTDCADRPFEVYAYALLNPEIMTNSIGIHHLEARAIFSEIVRRKYELHDIFAAYSSLQSMREIFKSIIPEL